MYVKNVIDFLESWVPSGAALADDNPGLQLGNPDSKVTNILVTLEITDRVIDEAIENQVNLILTHHPLIFKPLSRIDASSWLGRKIAQLMKHDVAVYAAHTNLDAADSGVSITLAKLLGVENPRFLTSPGGKWMKKVAVFVPRENLDTVREAMAATGAGNIGEYSHCSFNIQGKGTFIGSETASPVVGKKGNLETVEEVRLEMVVPEWKTTQVISAMREAHPYEEVAYDLYNLDNQDVNFGFGAIGSLNKPLLLKDFLKDVKQKLGVNALCLMEGPVQKVSRVAVCGGSGGILVDEACRQGADVYITGEMKYHTYLEYEGRLTVIVAGHYATERAVLPVWVERIDKWLADSPISVIETKILTNPVKYII